MFQHTAARRRLGLLCQRYAPGFCFNTQPPEGGWYEFFIAKKGCKGFNTQPPEGGWRRKRKKAWNRKGVSTHSRPKAAGNVIFGGFSFSFGFNTQPPEGGWGL